MLFNVVKYTFLRNSEKHRVMDVFLGLEDERLGYNSYIVRHNLSSTYPRKCWQSYHRLLVFLIYIDLLKLSCWYVHDLTSRLGRMRVQKIRYAAS